MVMASGMFRRRDVAQSWIAGATWRSVSSRARTTSCNMRIGCFVFKTVVSSYRSSNTHFKYSKWKEKALNCYKDTHGSRYCGIRRALSDEILLRGTSYVFISAGRVIFFLRKSKIYRYRYRISTIDDF